MPRLVWWTLVLVGALWTGLILLLSSLAGAGGAAIVAITRLLAIDPARTQWLADIVNMVSRPIQALIWVAWAVGVATLLFVARLVARAARQAQKTEGQRELWRQAAYGRSDEPGKAAPLDGEVTEKHIRRP